MGKVLVIKSADFSNACVEKITLGVNVSAICIPAEGGHVEGLGVFDKGSSVEITAYPNIGFKFKNWEDGSTEAVRNIIADIGGMVYTAYFSQRTNLINIDLTSGNKTPVYESTDGGATFSLNNTGYDGWTQINIPINGETILEGVICGYKSSKRNLIIPFLLFLDKDDIVIHSEIPTTSGANIRKELIINIPAEAIKCIITVFTGDKGNKHYILDQKCYIY